MSVTVRPASLEDLPSLTEIQNHYVIHTHITFDVRPFTPEQRVPWFHEHSDGKRYRLLAACDSPAGVLGYVCTGRHRTKEAYDTTVEASIACRPDAVGQGLGTLLYGALFDAIADQDIHRIVAGIAQPNVASNALHRRFGFTTIGVFSQVGRKFEKYWDVMWMERPLKLPGVGYLLHSGDPYRLWSASEPTAAHLTRDLYGTGSTTTACCTRR
ncbi:MAG TPA: GNAT family N-acetyltransferase [Bryobacteraceae bacterium]|nr:GNAT family N-acetyltransferase [Bryobacteraceae bacterium]